LARNGTDFASTEITSPVLGLRPARVAPSDGKGAKAAQFDPIAAPSAAAMPAKIVATMVSTSLQRRCVLAAASSAIRSGLVNAPAAIGFRNDAR
jgi:hypothetical protein